VHDWKVDAVSQFFELYSNRIRYGGEDTMCWVPSKRKYFEVKSYYQVLSTLVDPLFLRRVFEKLRFP
jgi:hypothetical protein